MTINPNILLAIQQYIEYFLNTRGTCTINDIVENIIPSIQATKIELINTINASIDAGNISVIELKRPWDKSEVVLVKPFSNYSTFDPVSIVISKPRFKELTLGRIEQRNYLLDTLSCFEQIISSSKNILRICSPFLQKNVLDEDSFPRFKSLLISALNDNVQIDILSRELFQGRDVEIQWIIDIAYELGKRDKLRIADYHISENKNIISSTHAKLIIADYSLAYIGSAELRKNSLIANFEVGCLVRGPEVFSICEVFDCMFSSGRLLDA